MAILAKSLDHRRAALGRGKIGEPARPAHLSLFVDKVSDKHVDAAGGAYRLADPVDVRNNLAGDRKLDRGARLHKTVLQVNDDVCGSRGNDITEHMEPIADALYAIQYVTGHLDLVHGDLSRYAPRRRDYCASDSWR